ncbi:putative cell filamentation protein [Bartonella quintana RM-11]|nr:putative cell filamentation protein [Bartonella quintana RM-11]
MTAAEGETYRGIYKGEISEESFMLNLEGFSILGNKKHLTQKKPKTLRPGDKFTFTAPRTRDLENTFISKETLAPLTKMEMAEMAAEDARVHTCRDQIHKLSEIVYGSSKTLDQKMVEIIKNPSVGDQLAEQIEKSPHSLANLAGFDLICFKSRARIKAKENVELLSCAVSNFAFAVRQAKKEITQEHQAEQNRRGQEVAMPSQSLKNLLSMPKELQQTALAASLLLQKELESLIKQVSNRLSGNEQRALKNKNYDALAKNLGVSQHKAKEITQTVNQARDAQKQLQTRTVSRSKVLAMGQAKIVC